MESSAIFDGILIDQSVVVTLNCVFHDGSEGDGLIAAGVHADTLKAPRPGSEPTWSGAPIEWTQALPNQWRKCW